MKKTNRSMASRDVYEIITARIIGLLEKGTVPWRKPWKEGGLPCNLVTKKPYRGINVWLLSSLNYINNWFLTWKQAHELGGSIKKGEKAHLVVFWKLINRKPNQETEVPKDEEKKMLLRYYKVFNIEQCINLPLKILPVENTINAPIANCEAIIERMPLVPRILHKSSEAFYNAKEDWINIPILEKFLSSETYYATLFHELIHSTGHRSRLDRKGIAEYDVFGSSQYSFEELIAEMGSCYLNSYAGIDNLPIENSAAYIKSWLGKLENDKRMVVLAGSQAQKATDYILGDTTNVNETEQVETELLPLIQ